MHTKTEIIALIVVFYFEKCFIMKIALISSFFLYLAFCEIDMIAALCAPIAANSWCVASGVNNTIC